VIIAAPILFLTFVCLPCGMVLTGMAAGALVIDLIPGTDGNATAALDLVNPMSVFDCAGKWAANTPTANSDPAVVPVTAADAEQDLVDGVIDLARAESDFLAELSEELRTGDKIVEFFDLVGSRDPTIEDLEMLKENKEFVSKLAKRVKFFKKFGKAVYQNRWGTRATRLSNVWKQVAKTKRPSGLRAGVAVAVEIGVAMYENGYFDSDILPGEYQDTSDLRNTSNFTDCLDQKYRLAGGT
jgi:hypothetical protein